MALPSCDGRLPPRSPKAEAWKIARVIQAMVQQLAGYLQLYDITKAPAEFVLILSDFMISTSRPTVAVKGYVRLRRESLLKSYAEVLFILNIFELAPPCASGVTLGCTSSAGHLWWWRVPQVTVASIKASCRLSIRLTEFVPLSQRSRSLPVGPSLR